MSWVKCDKCGFSQIPAEKCLRCGMLMAPPKPPPRRSRLSRAALKVVDVKRRWTAAQLGGAAVVGFGVIVFLGVWIVTSRPGPPPSAPAVEPTHTPTILDLAGRWTAEVEKTLPGPPPRPAIKSAYLETNRDGDILAAGILLTDPGRGGAGAGYRMAADGRRRLDDALALLSGARSAPVAVDFIPFPAWVQARQRLWRSLEATNKRREPVRYLLLESIEDDYVVQAGINEIGFLSYVFFSPTYGRARGVDALSRVIHPEPGSSLRGFQNLVWDFSGSADFLKLEVNAAASGPDGLVDRLKLKR